MYCNMYSITYICIYCFLSFFYLLLPKFHLKQGHFRRGCWDVVTVLSLWDKSSVFSG